MRANKLLFLLKVCIFSGLSLLWLTAQADDSQEAEYGYVPPVDECHYAEHPKIRETVYHKTVYHKYRHVRHHRIHAYRRYPSPKGLDVYYPLMPLPNYDAMWPSDDGSCCGRCGGGYVLAPLSSDDVMYSIEYGAPEYEGGGSEEACDTQSE